MVGRAADFDTKISADNHNTNLAAVSSAYTSSTAGSSTSPVPASVEFDRSAEKNSLDLQGELDLARKEIAELKKQLACVQVE